MKTSPSGIELIKRFEGLELESYQDIAGVWTIGYGHTETAGPNQKISEREAEELLRRDLVSRERAVSSLSNVPLNQNEFDALVSFVYNVGANAFRGSTARRRLNRGDRLGAADALTWWNKATVNGVLVPVTGLTRRRAAERALFLTPAERVTANELNEIDENSRIQPMEDPPRRGNLTESRTIQGASVAGGAGVAASSMGRDTAEEINELETNIEDGVSLTEDDDSTDGAIATTADDVSAPEGDSADDDLDAAPGAEETPSDDAVAVSDDPPVDPDTDVETPADDATTDEAPGVSEDVADDAPAEAAPTEEPSTDEDIVEEDLEELTEATETAPPPSKHDSHEGEAQLQFALMILIIFAVLYIIYARIEDWFTYRR